MMPFDSRVDFVPLSHVDTVGAIENTLTKRIERLSQLARRKKPAAACPPLEAEQSDCPLQQADDVGHSSTANLLTETKPMTKEVESVAEVESVDLCNPALDYKSARDCQTFMHIALYRLSKKQTRVGAILKYELPDGYVEVSAGAYGMATVWDYDIVLVMVSHLMDATDRYREGSGEKPGKVFRAKISQILRITRRGNGSRQAVEVEAALDRLQSTTIKRVRKKGKFLKVSGQGLIARYEVVSRTDTQKIQSVDIEAPDWLYNEVVNSRRPQVLKVHPDYFLLKSGIARFIYRQARRAAGSNSAKWSFQLLYEHSGSSGTQSKFFHTLRCLIESDSLPEYSIQEVAGKSGPQLVMTRRYLGNDQ